MKLSIVIPTRNRSQDLRQTIAVFCDLIEASAYSADIELICVNNFSTDSTEEVCRSFQHKPYFRYFKHRLERRSAETSAFYAVEFVRGEYIWFFGDDDTPLRGCLEGLIEGIDRYQPDLILQNLLFDREPGERNEYINSTADALYFANGIDFFRHFGLVTAVTTLSCICFSSRTIKIAHFERLAELAELYSHTAALLVSYFDKPCLFLPKPHLKYVATHESVEFQRMGGHSVALGRPPYYGFGHGLVRLITMVSNMTGLTISEIALFEEILIDKTPFLTRHTLLISFITRTLVLQLRNDPSSTFSNHERTELKAFIAAVGLPHYSVMWDVIINLNADYHFGRFEALADMCEAVISDHDQAHFSRLAAPGSGQLHTPLYFQHGVMPRVIYTDPAPDGASPWEVSQLSVVVILRDIAGLQRQFSYLEDRGALASLAVRWVLVAPDKLRPQVADLCRVWSARNPGLDIDVLPLEAGPFGDFISLSNLRGGYFTVVRGEDIPLPQTLVVASAFASETSCDAIFFTRRTIDDPEENRIAMHDYRGDRELGAMVQDIDEPALRTAFTRPYLTARAEPAVFNCKLFKDADLVVSPLSPVLIRRGPIGHLRGIRVDLPLYVVPNNAATDAELASLLQALEARPVGDSPQRDESPVEALTALEAATEFALLLAKPTAPSRLEDVVRLYDLVSADLASPRGAMVTERVLYLILVHLTVQNWIALGAKRRAGMQATIRDIASQPVECRALLDRFPLNGGRRPGALRITSEEVAVGERQLHGPWSRRVRSDVANGKYKLPNVRALEDVARNPAREVARDVEDLLIVADSEIATEGRFLAYLKNGPNITGVTVDEPTWEMRRSYLEARAAPGAIPSGIEIEADRPGAGNTLGVQTVAVWPRDVLHVESGADRTFAIVSAVRGVRPSLYELGHVVSFASPASDAYIVAGFHSVEPWGRWTDGPRAELMLQLSQTPRHDLEVELNVMHIFPSGQEGARIEMIANGEAAVEYILAKPGSLRLRLPTPAVGVDRVLRLTVLIARCKRPTEEPIGDTRALGIGVESLTVREATSM